MVEILKDNARPEAGAVYAAMDMPWAKLVGQIAQAYGRVEIGDALGGLTHASPAERLSLQLGGRRAHPGRSSEVARPR
jgi:hypothetical protein